MRQKDRQRSIHKKIGLLVMFCLVLIIGGFLIWALAPHQPMDEVWMAMTSDEDVDVINEEYISFVPKTITTEKTGLIIYPGARVDGESYSVFAKELAENGYYVFVTKPPLRLAVLDSEGAASVIEDYPEMDRWYIGGHSLGGTMSGSFAYEHQDIIDGIIYLAAYPLESNDFSKTDLRVLSLYASEDGFVTIEDIDGADYLQPQDYTKVLIEGGNHEQFGYYGHQKGDQVAEITRGEQLERVIAAVLTFISYSE